MNYYTPAKWTKLLIDALGDVRPSGILDPAVGEGALLVAAQRRYPQVPLFGLDVDRTAVCKARLTVSPSVISYGDTLSRRSVSRTRVWRCRNAIDTVVANPPFQDDSRPKLVCARAFQREVSGGIAVTHLVAVAGQFVPRSLVAIVPQSVFHSHRDEAALALLRGHYHIERVEWLGRTGFQGGNAATEMIRLTRDSVGTSQDPENPPDDHCRSAPELILVRGGLQVHLATESNDVVRIPFLHTTNLFGEHGFKLVSPMGHGVVEGTMILIPRVGLPGLRHLRVLDLQRPVQLSDCVIALCFAEGDKANVVCNQIRSDFENFVRCWGGTGAAYTTLAKIAAYLRRLGIATLVAKEVDWTGSDRVRS